MTACQEGREALLRARGTGFEPRLVIGQGFAGNRLGGLGSARRFDPPGPSLSCVALVALWTGAIVGANDRWLNWLCLMKGDRAWDLVRILDLAPQHCAARADLLAVRPARLPVGNQATPTRPPWAAVRAAFGLARDVSGGSSKTSSTQDTIRKLAKSARRWATTRPMREVALGQCRWAAGSLGA